MSDLDRLTVMQVMAGDEEGGLEKHVEELSNALAYRLSVIVVAHPKYADRFNSRVKFIPLDLTRNRNNPVTLLKLTRIIRKSAPDVVHAQAGKAAAIVAKVRKLVSTKLVATVHGLKKRQPYLNHFDLVIGVSKAVAESVPIEHKCVIYNGVQLGAMSSQPPPGTDAAARTVPLFLAIGRLVPVKGFDTLLKAWEQIPAQLQIVGDGPEQASLEAMVSASASLSEKVSFLGFRNDILDLIRAADCVIISSQREGFSYVFAEAMLIGTPVLSTDVPIANEVLDAQYLCPTNSPEALAALIWRHLPECGPESAELKSRFVPYFEWAQSHLAFQTMVDNTVKAYDSLMGA